MSHDGANRVGSVGAAANPAQSLGRAAGTRREYSVFPKPIMSRSRIQPLVLVVLLPLGCAGVSEQRIDGDAGSGSERAPKEGGARVSACAACAADSDCGHGEACAQFGGGNYCAAFCANDHGCSADRSCSAAAAARGAHIAVCVPRGGICPDSPHPTRDGGNARVVDGGLVTGNVGVAGGRMSRLYFVVIGDTRPANIDDTRGYPTAIITKIFRDVQSLEPAPLFGVSTGDYMFASTGGGQAAAQLNLYLYARSAFSGPMFPAMGNHECTGATASNCGVGTTDGVTDNYVQFLTKMLQPIAQTKPYYSIRVDSSRAAWTAKFVFVAANAWDVAQATWLENALRQPTTYTFIVRHEPASAGTAPGVKPAEQIMSQHPYTLAIVGHSHTCSRSGAKEVIIGNGGAPLTSSGCNYGFGLVQQRADNTIEIDMIDYATMLRNTSFAFAVHPDGSPAVP